MKRKETEDGIARSREHGRVGLLYAEWRYNIQGLQKGKTGWSEIRHEALMEEYWHNFEKVENCIDCFYVQICSFLAS